MPPDEHVLAREWESYLHSQEMLRSADNTAFQSQVAGVASVVAAHIEEDRKSFEQLRQTLSHQGDNVTKWFMGISSGLILVMGGIIAVLIQHK